MLMGYGIIAVPTGIVTSELTQVRSRKKLASAPRCKSCEQVIFDKEAIFCKFCGKQLPQNNA